MAPGKLLHYIMLISLTTKELEQSHLYQQQLLVVSLKKSKLKMLTLLLQQG